MEIRAARPEDLAALPAVELSAARAFRGLDVPERVFEEFAPAAAWSARQAAGTLWVAASVEGIQAFLAATARSERLHIDEFAVAQEHQGRGIGRRMLERVIVEARAAGFARISLTTFRNVPFNAPFYASLGFSVWSPAPPDIESALADEAARGLKERCAMLLDL